MEKSTERFSSGFGFRMYPHGLTAVLAVFLLSGTACKKKSSEEEAAPVAGSTSKVRTTTGSGGGGNSPEKTRLVATDESGGKARAIVRTSGDTRKLVLVTRLAGLKGTSVSFPPGSLELAVDLVIEEGMESADRRNLDDLGIDEENIEAKGSPVSIMVAQNTDALSPFQISLVLPGGGDAESLDPSRIVVVSLVRKVSEGGKIFRSTLTGDQLALSKSSRKVTFSSQFFGIFQLVVLKKAPATALADSADTEVTTPLLSAAQISSLPQIHWEKPLLRYNMFTRKFVITGHYNSDEFSMQSCKVIVRDQNSATVSYEREDGISTDFTFSVSGDAAQKLKGYFRCTDTNGRAVDSPWTELQTVQEKVTFKAIVNSGVNSVNSKSVNLSFNATQATKVYITREAGCGSGGSWTDLATLENGALPFNFTDDNTTVTFYFILEDKWGNKGSCTTHSFTHDTIAPTGIGLSIHGGASHVNTVNVSVSPVATGASEIYLTNTAGCSSGGSWVSSGVVSWVLAQTGGTATVYAKYRDEAGNESSCTSDTIVHDEVAPSGTSLSISSGGNYASSSTVSLSFAATGAYQMYVTNTAGCGSGGSWESYATTKTWTLGASNGTATVYVKFRDEAGNTTGCSGDDIVHDNQAPSTPATLTDGVTTSSTSSSPSLSWGASTDSGTGVSSYEVAIGTSAGGTDTLNWTDQGNVTSATISGLSLTWGNTYYASVRAIDSAGNPGSQINGDGFLAGWLQQAYVKASNNATANAENRFGYSVAVDGDTMVVGAPYEDSNATNVTNGTTSSANLTSGNSGAVYIYKRTGADWAQEAYLKAPNNGSEDNFGWSVDIDGDFVVVGANQEDSDVKTVDNTDNRDSTDNNSNVGSGAVYIYKRSGTTWTQDAYLKAPNNNNGSDSDEFGSSVAISGDLVVVGAPKEDHNQTTITTSVVSDDNSNSNAGAVYVFRRNTGSGNWEFKSFIKAANNESTQSDNFGHAVAIDGTTVVVGVPLEDSNEKSITNADTASANDDATESGAVYVYTSSDSGNTWTQQAYIKAVNASNFDYFGHSVAVSGDTIVVGAPDERSDHTDVTNGDSITGDNNNNTSPGAAYVYVRSAGDWDMQAYLKASNNSGSVQSKFGTSVAISGNLIAVGSHQEAADQASITNGTGSDTNSGSSQSGSVYVYGRTTTNWAQESYIKALNNGSSDQLGFSVALDGDTLIAGAIQEDNNAASVQNGNSVGAEGGTVTDSGAVYVISK